MPNVRERPDPSYPIHNQRWQRLREVDMNIERILELLNEVSEENKTEAARPGGGLVVVRY